MMNILLAMIPAFFWGTTYAVTKFTLPDWPPLLLGVFRALPAGLLLLLIKPSLPKKNEWRPLLLIGLINIAAFFSLIFVMALSLPSAISGIGMISVPVFAMVFHWIVKKKKPSFIQAFSGIALLLLAWLLFNPETLSLSPIGLGAMLAAIFCIIIGSHFTQTLGNKMDWWGVLTWQLIIGGLALAVVASMHAWHSPQIYQDAFIHFDTTHLMGLVWVCVLNTALGYSLYVWLLQRMSVVDFTFGGIANPISGIICGGILLGEAYTPMQYTYMTGMIVMSLMPQIVNMIKARHVAHIIR